MINHFHIQAQNHENLEDDYNMLATLHNVVTTPSIELQKST
jgi:hypothetical protein